MLNAGLQPLAMQSIAQDAHIAHVTAPELDHPGPAAAATGLHRRLFGPRPLLNGAPPTVGDLFRRATLRDDGEQSSSDESEDEKGPGGEGEDDGAPHLTYQQVVAKRWCYRVAVHA